jgi:hypothetical protein
VIVRFVYKTVRQQSVDSRVKIVKRNEILQRSLGDRATNWKQRLGILDDHILPRLFAPLFPDTLSSVFALLTE